MIALFLGLTLVNLLCLSLAATLGYLSAHGSPLHGTHVLAGALAAMVCIAVHCFVFTYFIATAKWIQHAVMVKTLDSALTAPTRSFKMQAFPAALLAMAATFTAAMLGAALDNYIAPQTAHLVAALIALAVNGVVALIELHAISRNARLIDSILAIINRPA
jgi:NhaP-type Na+/H+ or K+/H+ antiporter